MMFTSSTGVVINYRLDSIESSEQHLGSQAGSRVSDIECELTSEHTYASLELGTTLSLQFRQIDIVGISPGDQGLGLYTEISDSDDRGGFGFRFDLSNLAAEQSPDNGFSHTLRYFESKEFGQTVYPDVSEYTQSPDSFVFVSNAPVETRLSRMAISKGAGIVEFEQADGVVYTRIPP